ncbi:MAG TPA: DUF2141 domain-containing protein [Flavisolibacter sp.]|jgi:uncharacterized protein (DUF2141 family)|nr:DUF2141 domain-containing protein [Flavisolibacter sp.]
MMGLLIYLLLAGAIQAPQNKVIVEVYNFENNKGVCIVCLHNNNAAFIGKGEPVQKVYVTPVNKSATAIFNNVTEGTYAVSVIHDANSNNKFDTNFLGIPTEGYGASKNKLPFAAAPKFEANKFTVAPNSTSTLRIKLRYLF